MQAKWTGDGRYYDVVIEEAMEHGCFRVKFTQYGNTTEVPLEYLRGRPRGGGTKRSHEESSKEEGEAKGGGGTFVIPENLRILPSDSEEEKSRKRRKVKHLKGLFHKKRADEEEQDKQKSWQDYLSKVSGSNTLL